MRERRGLGFEGENDGEMREKEGKKKSICHICLYCGKFVRIL